MPHTPRGFLLSWRRAALGAVLGIATTIATAWSLAAVLPYRAMGLSLSTLVVHGSDGNSLMTFERVSRPGMARQRWCDAGESELPRWFAIDIDAEGRPAYTESTQGGTEPTWGGAMNAHHARTPLHAGLEDARGWPFLALSYALVPRVADSGPNIGGVLPRAAGGIALFDPNDAWLNGSELRALPLRPVWKGFIADSALYALCWTGILVAPRAIARARRARRGCCPECGYDLRAIELPACPECGIRIPARA